MKRYSIKAVLSDGLGIDAKVIARSKRDAIGRLMNTDKFREATEGRKVESIEIKPIPIEPIDNTRYSVRTISNKRGWYIVEDAGTGFRIEWKKGKYDETNRVIPPSEVKDAAAAATILREIGEYLYGNFKELV